MNYDKLIPLVIIAVFLIIMIVIARIVGKRVNNADEYLVAGRRSPLFLIVGSLFATFWGGGTIIGASGAAFNEGLMGVIEDPFAAGLALIIIGLFFAKTLRKIKINSIGELYKYRFGSNVSYFASFFMIPTYTIWTSVQLIAISKILNVLFNINFILSYIISVIVVVLFAYLGGILSVVWTDAIQMIIIFIGLAVILFTGINSVGGLSVISQNTPKDFWTFLPKESGIMPWITYLAMWVGMGLGNVPSPDLAQRMFIAKDEKTAKNGMIIAGILYWTVGFIPIIISLIGITMVSKGMINIDIITKDSELLVPLIAKTLLNPVMLGIFIASLIAAILSSASTSLFATAVLFSNDIYKPLFLKEKDKEKESKKLYKITKFFVVFVGIVSALVGLASNNLYDLTIFAFTLLFGTLFFPYVFALKFNFATSKGIISGMIVGFLINVIGGIVQKTIIPEPTEFYTLVPALANLIVIIIVSYFTKESSNTKKIEELYEKS